MFTTTRGRDHSIITATCMHPLGPCVQSAWSGLVAFFLVQAVCNTHTNQLTPRHRPLHYLEEVRTSRIIIMILLVINKMVLFTIISRHKNSRQYLCWLTDWLAGRSTSRTWQHLHLHTQSRASCSFTTWMMVHPTTSTKQASKRVTRKHFPLINCSIMIGRSSPPPPPQPFILSDDQKQHTHTEFSQNTRRCEWFLLLLFGEQ